MKIRKTIALDAVRNVGVMVFGAFGNPGGCSQSNQSLIAFGHPNFREFYAAVLAAQGSGKPVSAYVEMCDSIL